MNKEKKCMYCERTIHEVGRIDSYRGFGLKRKIYICKICKWVCGLYCNKEAVYWYLRKTNNPHYKKEITLESWNTKDFRKKLKEKGITYDQRYDYA